jgi:POT family proton-dependent oligopeptide transporter
MIVATLRLWLGCRAFVHVPAQPRRMLRDLRSRETIAVLAKLVSIYFFVSLFWALCDQTGSSWVLQAERMSRRFLGVEWYAAQVQAVNPALVLIFVPLFARVIYPRWSRVMTPSSVRKLALGMLLASIAFAIPMWVETRIAAGAVPNVGWQIAAYVLLTAAEALVSVTALEFSYTQAPNSLKSSMMAMYLLTIAMGNWLTAGINYVVAAGSVGAWLDGPRYYAFVAILMCAGAIALSVMTRGYRENVILQTAPRGV